MGRLKPDTNLTQVRANFQNVFNQTALEGYNAAPEEIRRRPGMPAELTMPQFGVMSGESGLPKTPASMMRGPLGLFIGVATLVLLVVCANVANLTLARSAMRQQEVTVRLALGGMRWRIIRQLLTESVLLSLMAGIVGILFAYAGINVVGGLTGPSIPVVMDLRILAFTVGLCVATGILFGLAPALRTTKPHLITSLKDASRTSRGNRSRLSRVLLVAQVAISLVLLVGAGLFVRSLKNVTVVEAGFNVENLVLFGVNPSLNRYEESQITSLYERMIDSIEAIPGVGAVTMSDVRLLSGSTSSRSGIFVEGIDSDRQVEVNGLQVRGNFFETMGIPLLAGRSFSSQDQQTSTPVAIINETLARQYFLNSNPIGKRFGFRPDERTRFEIVGVVKDAKYTRLSDPIPATIYTPYLQGPPGQMFFEVRTATEPHSLISEIRRTIGQLDPNLALFNVSTQAEERNDNLTLLRVATTIASGFGFLALFLASVGLYSIMSYNVTRRTGEIGIRMALGAQRLDVIRLVVGQTLILVIVGLVFGFAASMVLTRALRTLLYEVSPTDPITIVAALTVMLGVAAVAGYAPTKRATHVDPIIALRYE